MIVSRAELNMIVDLLELEVIYDDNGFSTKEYKIIDRIKCKEVYIDYRDKEGKLMTTTNEQRELLIVIPRVGIDASMYVRYHNKLFNVKRVKQYDKQYAKILIE